MAFTAQARNRGYAELWTAEIGPASVRILWTDMVKQGYGTLLEVHSLDILIQVTQKKSLTNLVP